MKDNSPSIASTEDKKVVTSEKDSVAFTTRIFVSQVIPPFDVANPEVTLHLHFHFSFFF